MTVLTFGVFGSTAQVSAVGMNTKSARIPVGWSQLFVTYSVEELQIRNLDCLLISQTLGTISQGQGRVDVPRLSPTFCRTLGLCTAKWVWQYLVVAG